MRSISVLVVVVVNVAFAAVQSPAARAGCGDGDSTEVVDGEVIHCQLEAPPTAPKPSDDASGEFVGPSAQRFVWQAAKRYFTEAPLSCPAVTEGDIPPEEFVIVQWSLHDLLTGEVLELRPETCHWVTPDLVIPPPPPPPVPPSTAEVVEQTRPLLLLEPKWNPKVRGLTGLETWLWCDDPGEIVLSIELRGFQIDAHAVVSDVDWSITGPETVFRDGSSCGSETDPSARWMPEIMGTAEVQANATWTGYWTLTGYGEVLGVYDLGSVAVEGNPAPYEIIEHVGVLVG